MKKDKDIIDRIAHECLLMRVRKLDRVLTSIYDAELRPFGLKASQTNVLVLIAKAGPIRRIEIGKRLVGSKRLRMGKTAGASQYRLQSKVVPC